MARPLVFDENHLQENKDTEDKVDIKSAVKPDQDDTRLSETSKSVLFNRLRYCCRFFLFHLILEAFLFFNLGKVVRTTYVLLLQYFRNKSNDLWTATMCPI